MEGAHSESWFRIPDSPDVSSELLTTSTESLSVYTDLPIYPTATKEEADSAESYVRTRFFRFLVWIRKVSQDATRSTYLWVPQQSWDRTWTDDELCEKYGITEEEQTYIADMIREMPA